MTAREWWREPEVSPSGPLWDEAVALLPGAAATVTRLGGTANSTWRVETGQGVFVVRLHDGWVDPSGINRERETRLQAEAARVGLAPDIIAADPAGCFLVTRFVQGVLWQGQDMAQPEFLRRLARRLRALHELPAPVVEPWDLGAVLAAHARPLAGADPASAPEFAALLARGRDILARTVAAGRTPCIVHNDVNHTNLVGPGPMLLDFEYAAVADPLSDLACLLAYYPEAQPHAALLLAEAGLPGLPVPQLLDLAWVYTLVSFLWYRRYELSGRMRPAERQAMEALRRRLNL